MNAIGLGVTYRIFLAFGTGAQPVVFDLDGNGIQITSLDRSTAFKDGGDGLEHRTAWAGAGDGVLFYDPDNTGEITERRQYVFTDWDPTATSDMAAMAAVFDTNGDGELSGAELADFRIMVTNADGSTMSHTLTELGITSIDLSACGFVFPITERNKINKLFKRNERLIA